MNVKQARILMVRACISHNDLLQRKTFPFTREALSKYLGGKGNRQIPDALERHILEQVEVVASEHPNRSP